MPVQVIQPELIVELSTEEQQLLSGGEWGGRRRCPRLIFVPRCGAYFRGGKGGGKGGGFDDEFDGGFDDDY
ncbi:MAG TPA: hypothetical protein VE956_05545 [Nodularia sp. (in: cyanobacteria)]|nr:hypothetical protein [Nodularia sp. (in: cyanobacteria)]